MFESFKFAISIISQSEIKIRVIPANEYKLDVDKTALHFTFPAGRNAADCSAECQLENVTNYFTALDEVYHEESTIAHIDHLLSILHEDVRYVHVDYEADFDRASWREAFIRNLKLGAYRNGTENEMRISNVIHGKNHIAVEYSHGVAHSDGSFESGEPLLVLFTFTEEKISRIEELW